MTPPPLPPNDRPPAGPPPLPAINEDALVTGIAGAEGLTYRQVLEEIGRGGRFVVFLYAISLLIITFRRSTGVQFVRAGETVGASAWGPTMLTLFVGWWGIPWGPIFSIQSIYRNAMGGKDVTEPMLTPLVGAERAKAALKLRPQPKVGVGLWSLRAALLAIPLVSVSLNILAAEQGIRREEELRKSPGYNAWYTANANLERHASGNNAEARTAAAAMKAMLDGSVTWESRTGRAKEPKPFNVWCEFHDHDAVVLVQWDDLRHLSDDNRETLSKMIWQAACAFARNEPARSTGSQLTVGLKGSLLWDRALLGKLPSADQVKGAEPAEAIAGHAIESRLVSAFAATAAQ